MDETESASGGFTMAASATSHADPALLDWLARHDVEFEVHEHAPATTALGVARAEGVDPHTFAKVVAVRTTDGRTAFVVVETTDQVDLRKAAEALDARHVSLLTEAELEALAPQCEIGAMPAVGALFEVPMLADYAVRDDRDISFNAGSHRFSVRVERAGWERATGVVYADLAVDRGDHPAWDRS
jgi:Ala-tRNA(Pro) deacylase